MVGELKNAILLYIAVVSTVLVVVLTGDNEILTTLGRIPIIGGTVSTSSDAKGSIISAQKNFDGRLASGSNERVKGWEAKYKKFFEESEVLKVIKRKSGDPLEGNRMMNRVVLPKLTGNVIYVNANDEFTGPREVFLVAIVGEGLEWQKIIGVINETAIIENPDASVTIWVKVDSETANELYDDYINNATRRALYNKVVDYAMEGRIQISPFNRFTDFAQQYI